MAESSKSSKSDKSDLNMSDKLPKSGVFSGTQYEKESNSSEETAGWFSQLTFTWVNPIFRISAAKRKLGEELETSDLWSCIPQDTAVHLIKRWDDAWNRKSKNAMDRKRHGEEVVQKESFWLFFGTMREIFVKILWKGFVFRALTVSMYLVVPFFMNRLLEYIDNRDVKPVSNGVLLVVGLVAAQAIRVVLENANYHTTVRMGWQTFTMLNCAVYQKSLRLSSSSRQSRTVGDMVNILQLDTMKLQYWCETIHQLWAAPVQVIGYVIILYIFIGWAAFVGLAVLVSIILISPALYSFINNLASKQIMITDTRVKVTNECLQGALAVKMAAWEENFADKINSIRAEELSLYKRIQLLTSVAISLIQAAPTFGTVAAVLAYAFAGNELDAPTIFTAVAIFEQVARPVEYLIYDLASTVQAMMSIQRVGDFMMMEEIEQSGELNGASQDGSVHIHDAEFSWARGTAKNTTKKKKLNKKKKKSPRKQESLESSKGEIGTNSASVLKDINLDVKPKSLTAIIGPVGAGKSSLCGVIIGELHTKRGKVQVNGSVAYAAQTPWILNATLRDNILFGEEFNHDRYWKVIRVCQLRHDLDVLKAGDMTMIGEKGINLSGGQKQRVSIARAAYSSKQIVLLDDPLSALDPEVASNVFNDCIRKFMSDRTRILVTNQLNFLRFCDWVVVLTTSDKGIEDIAADDSVAMNGMSDTGRSEANPEEDVQVDNVQETVPGYISEQGTFQDLMNGDARFSSLVQKYNKQQHEQQDNPSSASLGAESQHERDGSTAANDPSCERNSFAEDTLMQVEERSRGSVKLKDYRGYVKAGGGYVAFAFLILLLSLQNAALVLSSAWVGLWTRAEERNYTTFESGEPVFFDSIANESLELYAYGYIVAGVVLMLFAFMAAAGFALFTLEASVTMHHKVLTSVLNSPMSFFDTTPLGRIIARFSADMTTLDLRLSENLMNFCSQFVAGIGILVTISVATPWFLAFILPLSLVYRYVLQIFRPVTRELQRISSIARSPIYSHFSETIGGLTTIRSYNKVDLFAKQNIFRVNQFAEAFAIQRSADRWLAIRLEFIGILVVAAAAGLAVGGTVDAAVAGISLTYAITITTLLNYGVRSFSYLENGMNSYERVNYYATQIEQEQPRRSSNPPDKTWPSKGEIVLNNLRMRYREGTPLVLKGLSLTIRGGERVGVVGRTGSGKSSLMLCLLRLVEPEDAMTSSPIMIDGVDVCKIGLYELRRKISIVPQNPTIFSGTVRSNLDPFTQYSDKEIWGALEKVGLKQLVSQSPGKLEFIMSEFGENFSQGQRQLLCLARTLLNKSQILLLDEATSSIDFETDMLIQNTIRSKTSFDGCTILTIAHRINTVLDSDRILVLNEGRVAEYDSPEVLLEDSTSMFSQMAQARDEES